MAILTFTDDERAEVRMQVGKQFKTDDLTDADIDSTTINGSRG